jgi:hypothetical protein
MANVFLALTAIHTTLAAHGKFGLRFQRVLMVGVSNQNCFFLQAPPQKKQYVL